MQKFPAGRQARTESHDLIPLGELRKLIPDRPAPTTLDNWCKRGVSGVTLKHRWRGGWRYSCWQWYEDFQKGIAEARQ